MTHQIQVDEATAALRRITVYLVDATDGFTPETGRSGTATVTVDKNGAGFGASAGSFTEIGVGHYYYEATAGEVDTLGALHINVADAESRNFPGVVQVVAFDPYTDIDTILSATHGDGSWQQTVVAGSSLNVVADAASTVSTGNVVANLYSDTHTVDGVEWQIEDVGGGLDMYFEFTISADGIPSSVTHVGRINGGNDDLDVFAYNWGATAWEQIGTLGGKNPGSNNTNTYALLAQHVGTSGNLGLVRVRYFTTAGLTAADFYTDQILLSYAAVNRSVGYADGAIWVDTNNGVAGATVFQNGTADNPVLTWANALTLSAALGIRRFHIAGGSTIALSANSDSYQIVGAEYTLDLNGQSIAAALIVGANVSGTFTGVGSRIVDCRVGDLTAAPCTMVGCGFTGTFTISAVGAYFIANCHSGVAGTSAPVFDVGAGVADTQLNMRNYSGGVDLRNIGQSGTDTMSLEGNGQIILAADCVGGTIAIRGNFTVTDNAGGAVTLSDLARFDLPNVQAAMASQGYTTTRAPYLDELKATNLPADVDAIVSTLAAIQGAGFVTADDSLEVISERVLFMWRILNLDSANPVKHKNATASTPGYSRVPEDGSLINVVVTVPESDTALFTRTT